MAGRDGEHIVFTARAKPFLHVVGVNSHERFHERCTTGGAVRDVATSSDGSLLFASIDRRVFVWMLATGELLGVRECHLQDVSCMVLSEDDSTLVTSSEGGEVKVHLVSDLIKDGGSVTSEPLRTWRAHTLAVRGVSVSGSSVRVASCSLDHTAAVHSVALDACLLRISSDRPLTSCLLCPSESRLFLASDKGDIAVVSLYLAGKEDKREMTVSTTNASSGGFLLQSHSHQVNSLAVNADGTMLASGDASGKYCIWQVSSKQVLKGMPRPNFQLQRAVSERKNIPLMRRVVMDTQKEWMEVLDDLLKKGSEEYVDKDRNVHHYEKDTSFQNDVEIMEIPVGVDADLHAQLAHKDDVIQRLTKETLKLKKINAELYEFASKELVGKGKK